MTAGAKNSEGSKPLHSRGPRGPTSTKALDELPEQQLARPEAASRARACRIGCHKIGQVQQTRSTFQSKKSVLGADVNEKEKEEEEIDI